MIVSKIWAKNYNIEEDIVVFLGFLQKTSTIHFVEKTHKTHKIPDDQTELLSTGSCCTFEIPSRVNLSGPVCTVSAGNWVN